GRRPNSGDATCTATPADVLAEQPPGERDKQYAPSVDDVREVDCRSTLAKDVPHRRPQQVRAELVEDRPNHLQSLALAELGVLVPERPQTNRIIEVLRDRSSKAVIEE